jgi:hypothetical protein
MKKENEKENVTVPAPARISSAPRPIGVPNPALAGEGGSTPDPMPPVPTNFG